MWLFLRKKKEIDNYFHHYLIFARKKKYSKIFQEKEEIWFEFPTKIPSIKKVIERVFKKKEFR